MDMRPIVVRVLVALLVVALAPVTAKAATWAEENCSGGGTDRSSWTRLQARGYAEPMANEGYEWNGGCYRINDRDDTPYLDTDAGGEGADCSGFVFRVWGLKNDGSSGYRRWDYEKEIHGPYYTWHYADPAKSHPFRLVGKTYTDTTFMDAFVYVRPGERHVALIHTEGLDGWDYVIHARNNTDGTLLEQMPYRSYSDSKAVEREAWTPECFRRCTP